MPSSKPNQQVEALAARLDRAHGLAVWDGGEWALVRGVCFAWLLTRRLPDRPTPFVDPQSHAQVRMWLGGRHGHEGDADAAAPPVTTRLDRDWYAATVAAEASIALAVAQLADGRAGLRLLIGDEREVIVGNELCAISPVPPREGGVPTVAARRGNAGFAALVRRVHEGTVADALEPLPAGYLARALARGVVYGPQIATLSDGTRTVGRLPERR